MSDNTRSRHVNSLIHTIIQYIKTIDHPVTFPEIEIHTRISLQNNPKLLTALSTNPKVILTANTLQFKPVYSIRSEDDLHELIRNTNCKNGISLAHLLDSPVDVQSFVDSLRKKNIVFLLKDSDNSEILYFNPLNSVFAANIQIKKLYDDISVPSYTDILTELSSAGIKVEKRYFEKRKNVVVKKNQVRRFRRKIKITNTHVKGLNLNDIE